ncbi:MurR/RpiR family transcriptional regulator [Spiroplasma apis]|uniref:RpiR family transcriptional regulator n=1 Tax=Spiroplasma apis B31 TaxID=1276258 RepID=V5RJ85_SPIAP|nr:MurR/RpiR family transcriptional regulator [Spiroplasma apis]AHB36518.1 RpiR family transcriptional regulator [Spiroplasma apis B31]
MKSIELVIPKVKLSNSEAYLAQYINQNPEIFITEKINDIAKKANVSTSTITRLSKKLGYQSLKDFQLEISNKHNFAKQNYDFIDETNTNAIINNLKLYHSYSLNETFDDLDSKEIDKLVAKMKVANKILLYGVGTSYMACRELANNLEKIGMDIILNTNYHQQLLHFAKLDQNSMVLLISKSGMSKEIQFLIQKSKENNIQCGLITSSLSFKNVDKVDYLLNFKTYEDNQKLTSISCKLSQLVVVDLIFMELFKTNIEQNAKNLEIGYDLIKEWNSTK